MKELTHHLLSVPFMVFGSTAVLAFVHYLNEAVEPPEMSKTGTYVEMLAAAPPKKHKPKRTPIERRTARRAVKGVKKLAPIPNLSSPISGADFNIPGYDPVDIAALAGTDLGETPLPSSLVMTEDSVDQPAKPLHRFAPKYPDDARARGITGYVTLKMKIGRSGAVQQLRVTDAKPKGVFELVAEDAVRRWEFAPALYNGEPVDMWAVQTLRFELASR